MWDDCQRLGNVRKSTFVTQRRKYWCSYSTLKKTKLKIKMSCEYRLDKSWNWICLRHIYIYEQMWKLVSRVLLYVIPWTIQSMEFSRPECWSGQPFPSPGIFPTQELNRGLLHCRADSLPTDLPGKLYIYICILGILKIKEHYVF